MEDTNSYPYDYLWSPKGPVSYDQNQVRIFKETLTERNIKKNIWIPLHKKSTPKGKWSLNWYSETGHKKGLENDFVSMSSESSGHNRSVSWCSLGLLSRWPEGCLAGSCSLYGSITASPSAPSQRTLQCVIVVLKALQFEEVLGTFTLLTRGEVSHLDGCWGDVRRLG